MSIYTLIDGTSCTVADGLSLPLRSRDILSSVLEPTCSPTPHPIPRSSFINNRPGP